MKVFAVQFFIKQIEGEYKSSYVANDSENRLGLAVDLGTTHICVAVCDLHSGERLASYITKNPQVTLSAEIISRLVAAADSPQKAEWLQKAALESIAEIIKLASEKFDISSVEKLYFVGNTAMLSILTQENFEQLINPETWALKAQCTIKNSSIFTKSLALAQECEISIIQPLGGFVGSDLLAGLISERMSEKQAAALLIDFGTNSEIALWDKNRFWVTSAAGGPAFEGSGISCGMPAVQGAIYKVEKEEQGGYRYFVIDDAEPVGLCGSGLVDALALALAQGKITKNGKIKDGSAKIELEGSGFAVTSHDIDAIQRAKAAISAGIETLCHDAGVPIENIEEYYICGAFGKYLNTAHASLIGLLPDLTHKKVKICGNSALSGCQDMLVSKDALDAAQTIRNNLTVTNLGTSEFFEDSFFRRLFF